jgi:hypothetical protein
MKSLILVSVWIILSMMGCTTTKDNRAVKRVQNKESLRETVYRYALQFHPIERPGQIITPGKDSIIYIRDTIVMDPKSDSAFHKGCPTVNLDSLRRKNRTTDTIKLFHTDTLRLMDTLCERKNLALIKDNGILIGQNNQLQKENSELKKVARNRMLGIIGEAIAILFLAFLLMKNTFK